MPVNAISVGKDVSVYINDSNGPVTLTRIKRFSAKQKTNNRETVALDGINRHVNIPMGWEGDMEFERVGSGIDDYFANFEANYYAGQNLPTASIIETITEPSGAITQYEYIGVVFSFSDAGDWRTDEYITQKINFSAQQRIKRA